MCASSLLAVSAYVNALYHLTLFQLGPELSFAALAQRCRKPFTARLHHIYLLDLWVYQVVGARGRTLYFEWTFACIYVNFIYVAQFIGAGASKWVSLVWIGCWLLASKLVYLQNICLVALSL